jgi:hypothetical protein
LKVISDASDVGVGAILLQDGRPVAYFSKKLNAAERNYSTTEKELAGVMYALKEWRCYLLGNSFKVVTDHKSNSFLQEQSTLTPRRARWAEFLQNFSIEWVWAPGRKNPADPLSRHPDFQGTSGTKGVAGAMGVGVTAGAITLPSCSREEEVWLSRGRGRQLKREYLIKWLGYEDINNTWEPEDNLEHAREALQTYWDNHGVQARDKEGKGKKRKR